MVAQDEHSVMLAQFPESLRSAVLGNVGTIISFRVVVEDAPLLAREFAPPRFHRHRLHAPAES
jgi:hypothetical protein